MPALRRLLPVVAALAVTAVALPAAAGAKDTLISFQTPSHGIGCFYGVFQGKADLRCDVRNVTHRAKRPASCQLDYGNAFGLTAKGRARRLCVGDTALNPKAKVIAYGQTKHYGPFTCLSKTSGLRCSNKAGHGFLLARDAQSLF